MPRTNSLVCFWVVSHDPYCSALLSFSYNIEGLFVPFSEQLTCVLPCTWIYVYSLYEDTPIHTSESSSNSPLRLFSPSHRVFRTALYPSCFCYPGCSNRLFLSINYDGTCHSHICSYQKTIFKYSHFSITHSFRSEAFHDIVSTS